MNYLNYFPEGSFCPSLANSYYLESLAHLQEAGPETVLEHFAVSCDAAHNLHFELPCGNAVIPREECALGIAEGTAKEIAILSRVGKPICFSVLQADETGIILSRRRVQERTRARLLQEVRRGDVLYARATHIEPFGIFVDIGSGVPSFIGIENLSVSRIAHPREHFKPGQELFAVVTRVDQEANRLYLSHKELLGTWEENVSRFHIGETVRGIVRSIEPYGIFVELAPNLSGLADPRPGIARGDHVSVHIRNIIPARMKIKLNIIDRIIPRPAAKPYRYYLPDGGHLARWQYSPAACTERIIETSFE